MSVVVFANLEAETVGTQIDGGEDVCGGGSHVVDTGGEKCNVTLPVWALTINDEKKDNNRLLL